MNKKTLILIILILSTIALSLPAGTLFARSIERDVTRITGPLTEDEREAAIFTANFLILKSGKELSALTRAEYRAIIETSARVCWDEKVKALYKLGDLGRKALEEFLLLAHKVKDRVLEEIEE